MKSGMFMLLLCSVCLVACAPSANQTVASNQKNAQNVIAANYNAQLGLEYLKQGTLDRAKQKLVTALQQAPRSAEANTAMAHFLEQTGEVEAAKQYYQKALQYAPGKGAFLNNYGAFLCRHKQYAMAENYFLQAVNDPNYLNIAGAYENAAICVKQIPDVAKAKYYFEKAVEHNPKLSRARFELSKLYVANQEYREARKQLTEYEKIAQITTPVAVLGYDIAQNLGETAKADKYALFLDKASSVA